MLHTMWSVKGGSGVTLVTARLARAFAERKGRAVIVDLRGDQPALLGLPEPETPGVCDWLASPDGSSAALSRLLVDVGDGLSLLPRGSATAWTDVQASRLATAFYDLECDVVIDAGVLSGPHLVEDAVVDVGRRLAGSGRSLMVTRPCYLALRRAMSAELSADGVILVREPGRVLGSDDVAAVLRRPVLATVEVDPAIARAVDAGTLMRSTRRTLDRSLRGVA
ncbi:hypothetical protein BH10ACT3_BH10ACT3_24470 [soil metagenome]